MKCLACWEEIDEDSLICSHCGSDQNKVKDYFVLALMKQQKRKIAVPSRTEVLEYIMEVDPEAKNEITVTSGSQSLEEYKPSKLSAFGIGSKSKPEPQKVKPTQKPSEPTKIEKTLLCPTCKEEVPFRKFCKFCGAKLQKECPSCNAINRVTAKFCTKCGEEQEVEN